MKRLVALLLLVALSGAIEHVEDESNLQCKFDRVLNARPHSVSILEFGAVGDGKTSNTLAFQNAIFYLKSFADKGGAQLYVPRGKWLTGPFNLTSHLTLFLEKDAVILASQDISRWDVVEPLPSYGRGIEFPGGRYRSLITGNNLSDVVITGDNGTIDGQGSVWWEKFISGSINHSRPHLVELISSNDVVISNLTFLNSPLWNIHPVYCSNILIQNITAYSPPDSPYTSGIVPDSSENVCIGNSDIGTGFDAIVLKSGWDEYGIAYGKPTTNVQIREVRLQSSAGSALAFGSEMSGGISNIIVENINLHDSSIGIELKTSRGRGGYMEDIFISGVEVENVGLAIKVTGQSSSHPDDKFDPKALPVVRGITFKDIVGVNVEKAGSLEGIDESPFGSICLSNVSLSITSQQPSTSSWVCSDVSGYSENVYPEPCLQLRNPFPNYSSAFSFILHPNSRVTAL